MRQRRDYRSRQGILRRCRTKYRDRKRYCYTCHRFCKRPQENVTEYSEYLGDYVVEGQFWVCPSCGEFRIRYLDSMDAYRRHLRRLLLKEYPPDGNEYLTDDQIQPCPGEEELDGDAWKESIFHTEYDGREIYLKKSYDLYQRTGYGLFPLVETK